MRQIARNDYDSNKTNRYLTCISRIEMLDKRNDQFGDCAGELMQAISELENVTKQYVHRGRTDPNDEDSDAFEYENYHY